MRLKRFASAAPLALAIGMVSVTTASVAESHMEANSDFSTLMRAVDSIKKSATLGFDGSTQSLEPNFGAPTEALQHLQTHPLGLRLSGESDSRTWPFYVTASQLQRPMEFRLSYMNAVSVMPEASQIMIRVNDNIIHSETIRSSTGPSGSTIIVPQQVLTVGYNAMTISATQRHRVDCSPAATYELWTDINMESTGFRRAVPLPRQLSIADLPVVSPGPDGHVRIRALLPENPTDVQIQQVFELIQLVSIGGDYVSPRVEIGEGFGPGLDVFVGSMAQLEARSPDLVSEISGAGPLYIVGNPETDSVLVAYITNGNFSPAAMRAAMPIAEAKGTNAGLRALASFSGARVLEGEKVTFRDLGFRDEEFRGRLYRRSFQVNLSPDFFAADYNEARLNLTAGYSEGLTRKSALTVRLNGATISSVALGNVNGDQLRNKQLELALGTFRPGRNTIELEAYLPKASDLELCANLTSTTEKPRFALSAESSIEVPKVAHFGTLPNIGNTLRTGFPYNATTSADPARLFLVDREVGTVAAAGTMLAHMATSTGRPLNFDVSSGLPGGEERNAIIIGALDSMQGMAGDALAQIDIPTMLAGWRSDPLLSQFAMRGDGVDDGATASLNPEMDMGTVDEQQSVLLDNSGGAFSRIRQTWGAEDIVDSGPGGLEKFRLWGRGLMERFGLVKPIDISVGVLDDPTERLLISQSISPRGEGAWTVVAARDSAALAELLPMFLRSNSLNATQGTAIGFNGQTNTITNVGEIGRRQGVMGDYSFSNIRLVIAGWLANNPIVYMGLLAIIALFGGVLTHRMLRVSGRQPNHQTGSGSHG